MNEQQLEKMLHNARLQIWDKPNRGKAIKWLKRQLSPYYNERAAQREHERGQRMLQTWA
jgi:hypothetical protein